MALQSCLDLIEIIGPQVSQCMHALCVSLTRIVLGICEQRVLQPKNSFLFLGIR